MAAAFAAAYLLVLQSVVGAFALGVGPSPAQLDAFGNIICTHDGTGKLPDGGPQQRHMPNCCVLGCALASSALCTPPAEACRIELRSSFHAIDYLPAAPAHLAFERDRSPANPRAPPAA
ncbi:MAG TPA: hypothetical protein VGM46_09910 [Mesorhizobium sp.]